MVLAGLSSLVPSMAQNAQNAQNPQRLRARVAAPTIKNGHPTDIYILSANGPTVQFVESRESQEVLQQMDSAFKTLYILKRPTLWMPRWLWKTGSTRKPATNSTLW